MKNIFATIALVFTGSVALAAAPTTNTDTMSTDTTTMQTTENQSTVTFDQIATRNTDNVKNVGIFLGYSSLNDGESSEGHGITTAAEWYYNQFLGLGANFSHYDATNHSNFWTTAAYLRATPIRYQIEAVKLAASVNAGAVWTDSKYEEIYGGLYFGAALEANFIGDVGVRLEQTISDEDNSQTAIGFVGYY